ncbi:response regulator transcription factor [Serratia sp. JSRIV001]|uniref:response regulator transcription factor n=1 Tax=Serratia sp. JSRIV001 TaxID=2831893 RepID=UPI001CBE5B85|nr:LuxR C-terminal-related transcriptional regulator [Serratia sp. JSRIV001]UAN45371.1 response regulator transcription factor [Serratia sp. JSRIV001]
MTNILKVLIIDKNQAFASGIQQLLAEHFFSKNFKLTFTKNKSEYAICDLIFLATDNAAAIMPVSVLDKLFHGKLITISSNTKKHATKSAYQNIFYRGQCARELIELIEKILMAKVTGLDMQPTRKYNPLALMTPRQKEVLYYISIGMVPYQIAYRMNLNEKTISNHKRNAMNRLQLKKTTELYHWLLINDIVNFQEQ